VFERRRARRFDVEWGVVVRGKNQAGSGFTEEGFLVNLSSRGAFLHLRSSPALGSRLNVLIKLPDQGNGWMAYSAEVIRVEDSSPKAGVAMRFSPVRPKVLRDTELVTAATCG
jgi:PilZ domain-containing protein